MNDLITAALGEPITLAINNTIKQAKPQTQQNINPV